MNQAKVLNDVDQNGGSGETQKEKSSQINTQKDKKHR